MKRRVKVEEWKCPALGWFIPGFDAIAISTLLAVSSMLFDSALPVTKLPDIPAEHHLGGWGFAYAELDAAGRVYHRGWPIAPERYRELFTEFVRGNHLRATRLGFSGWENETLGWVSTLRLELRIDREHVPGSGRFLVMGRSDGPRRRTGGDGAFGVCVPLSRWPWFHCRDSSTATRVRYGTARQTQSRSFVHRERCPDSGRASCVEDTPGISTPHCDHARRVR